MKYIVLILSFLLLISAAQAEELTVSMRVGEAVEVVLFEGNDEKQLSASVYIPMDWCQISDSNGRIVLSALPPAVGQWMLDLQIKAYAPGDKKGKTVASYKLLLNVEPDDAGNTYHPDRVYRNDGAGMIGVRVQQAEYCRVPGGPVMGEVNFGDRLIYTGLEGFANEQWFHVYHRSFGYGFIRSSQGDPFYEHPLEVTYTPGQMTTVRIWHTEQRMDHIRLQKHECVEGELADISFSTLPGDGGTWYTNLHMVLTGEEGYVRHVLQLVSLDDEQQPMEVISVIATPKGE